MTFTITQGDNSPSLVTTLSSEDSSGIDLSNASDVRFIMQDMYERVVIDETLDDAVRIVDEERGIVEFIFSQPETETVGEYEAEFEVTYTNGAVETFPTDGKIDIKIVEHIA
jgi:hypothetical protein